MTYNKVQTFFSFLSFRARASFYSGCTLWDLSKREDVFYKPWENVKKGKTPTKNRNLHENAIQQICIGEKICIVCM